MEIEDNGGENILISHKAKNNKKTATDLQPL